MRWRLSVAFTLPAVHVPSSAEAELPRLRDASNSVEALWPRRGGHPKLISRDTPMLTSSLAAARWAPGQGRSRSRSYEASRLAGVDAHC
ncbi:predicted protein [Coccidioides posadasii str. Silveira]|uniref:Predicted protein n=1 Tax=Coccidioides posadasii (strain RMSCC 757 / Silveira) TaxID=443226 RepID=E9CRK8_COCPS|nr:predicted protein [Coccidioides posadasii str. Silveira]